MTLTAVKEKIHGLNPIPYQIERANTELSGLIAELKKAEARRKELVVQGISRPHEENELKTVEQQIGNLRLQISRIKVKIEGLEEDLPRIDVEVRTHAGNLETAKERLLLITPEIEALDDEAVALCHDKAVMRLVEIAKQRSELVEELTATIPRQIQKSESYLHLAPTREFPRAPERPEKVQCLLDILK